MASTLNSIEKRLPSYKIRPKAESTKRQSEPTGGSDCARWYTYQLEYPPGVIVVWGQNRQPISCPENGSFPCIKIEVSDRQMGISIKLPFAKPDSINSLDRGNVVKISFLSRITLFNLVLLAMGGLHTVAQEQGLDARPSAIEGPTPVGQPRDVRRLFHRLDINRNGALEAHEVPEQLFRRLSMIADANNDGRITLEELTTAFGKRSRNNPQSNRTVGPEKKGDAMAMIRRLDQDQDLRISLEEAPEWLKRRFAQLDRNGDGYLDQSELESMLTRTAENKMPKNRTDKPSELLPFQHPKRPPHGD